MTKRVRLLVGTKKGAFILDSDEARIDWSIKGPLCEGWPVHDMIVEPGHGRHPGRRRERLVRPGDVAVRGRRRRPGRHSSAGLTYGDEAEPVKTIWSLATTPGRRHPGGRRAGRPLPQRRPRQDLAPRRGPDQPSDPPDLGTRRRRAHPPHDHPPPDRHRPDLGRDLGGRRLRDARRRGVVGAAQRGRPRRVQPREPLPGHRAVRPQVRDGGRRARDASTSATTAASTAPTTARRPGRRSPARCRPTSGSPWSPTRATRTPAG